MFIRKKFTNLAPYSFINRQLSSLFMIMSQKSLQENWISLTFSENIRHPFPFFYESNIAKLSPSNKEKYIAILKDEL